MYLKQLDIMILLPCSSLEHVGILLPAVNKAVGFPNFSTYALLQSFIINNAGVTLLGHSLGMQEICEQSHTNYHFYFHLPMQNV